MSIWQSLAALFAALFRAPAQPAEAPLPIPVAAVGDPPIIGQSTRFGACLAIVLKHEGGYVDHPSDPGGATNLGITIGTLSDWLGRPATKQEVRGLTRDIAAAIYHKRYWLPVRGDALGPGLDLAVFDFAVNSGPGRAIKTLQAALGVPADGIMGPATLGALVGRNRADMVAAVCGRRMAFLQALKTWPVFGKGWQRRVSDVQAAALAALNA